MIKLIGKLVLVAVLFLALVVLGRVTLVRVDLEMQDMKAEHTCIGKYISQEIPRNQIAQGNGQCWIKESYKGL